ncbi:Sarcosine/dimethylglycine N-methyltransferase [Galdieria sulphuraria]|nr:Sarcosine/dimethylglycine N-methyltransferase [Galdieria sulphuraria]
MPGNSNYAVKESVALDNDSVQKYYDNTDTDEFYFRIWGGEDLHLAFYDKPLEEQNIRETSTKAVHWLSRLLYNKGALQQGAVGVDLGAGYGGSARFLCSTYGVHIDCVNISEWQNRRNVEITEAAGLSGLLKVHLGSFTDLPCESNSYNFAWCEEALIHSPDKLKVFQEAHRVLKKGGFFLLTDPLQKEISHEELVPILERAHLVDMGSRERYRDTCRYIWSCQNGIGKTRKDEGRLAKMGRCWSTRQVDVDCILISEEMTIPMNGTLHWKSNMGSCPSDIVILF